LSNRSVANIIKAYAERARFDTSTFSGHSLRAGFLTSAAGKGASIFKMMDVSRHKSVDTLRGYVVRPNLNYIIPSLNKTANCTRCGDILSISATSSTCDRAPNRGMKAITAGTSAAEDGLSFRPPDLQSHTAGIGPACSAGTVSSRSKGRVK